MNQPLIHHTIFVSSIIILIFSIYYIICQEEQDLDKNWFRQLESSNQPRDFYSSSIDLLNELSRSLRRPYVTLMDQVSMQIWANIEDICGKDWSILDADNNVSYSCFPVISDISHIS
jgi:hypothetical protein